MARYKYKIPPGGFAAFLSVAGLLLLTSRNLRPSPPSPDSHCECDCVSTSSDSKTPSVALRASRAALYSIETQNHIQNLYCTYIPLLGEAVTLTKANIDKRTTFTLPITYFPMFVYAENDLVSRDLITSGHMNLDFSNQFLRKLESASQRLGLARKDIAIVDIGSNVGWYSFLTASAGFRAFAFEPVPRNQVAIRHTICQSPKLFQDSVTLFPVGLGKEVSQCSVISLENNIGNGNVWCDDRPFPPNYHARGTIQIETLDSYLDTLAPFHIEAMKIDVEGFEYNLLRGARKFFEKKRIPYILCELMRNKKLQPTDPIQTMLLWNEYGYDVRIDSWDAPIIDPKDYGSLGTGHTIFDVHLTLKTMR